MGVDLAWGLAEEHMVTDELITRIKAPFLVITSKVLLM